VCAKQTLPWGSKISRDLNYRATTAAMWGGGSGILDIL